MVDLAPPMVQLPLFDAEPSEYSPTPARTPTTIGELGALYLESLALRARPSSVVEHRKRFYLAIAPELGALRLSDLSPLSLQRFVVSLARRPSKSGAPVSPAFIHNCYNTLAATLEHGVRVGALHSNPARALRSILPPLEPSTRSQQKPRAFDLPDLERLFSCEAISIARTIELATATLGVLRPGECRSLLVTSIHLSPGAITIARSGSFQPKTPRSARSIPLHPQLVGALHFWIFVGFARAFGRPPSESDPLFPSERGTPQTARRSAHRFARELRAAGLPLVGLHALRHSGASLYRRAGCDFSLVAAMLGHAAGARIPSNAVEQIARVRFDALDHLFDGRRKLVDRPSVCRRAGGSSHGHTD